MKNIQSTIKGILIFTFIGILCVSCQDSLDDLRENPNNINTVDDAALFTNAARSLFGRTTSTGAYKFAGQHAHYYLAGNNARFPDGYSDGFDDDYNGFFNGTYGSVIRHIEEVLVLTSNPETANPVRYAIADVIAVMGYAVLTDGFGEIPYTEGGKGKSEDILTPKYDTQEFIYTDLIARLTSSINVLKTADPAMGYLDSDFIFDNDLTKWVRFANSVRLRLAMRLRFVDNALSQQVVSQCLADPLMTDNTHNAYMIETEGQGNPWFTRKTGFPRIKVSEMFVNQLESTADPRLDGFVDLDGNGNHSGILNGLTDAAFGVAGFDSKSNMGLALSSPESKLYLMTAAEVYFLKAEIALIYDNDPAVANSLYRMGVETSLDQWDVDNTEITTFLASSTGTLTGATEEQEEQIGLQMWLALTPNYFEGWCYIRRTGHPIIAERTEDHLSRGVTNGIMPKRFKYSTFELSANGTNVNEAINRQGENKIDTPVWWDKN